MEYKHFSHSHSLIPHQVPQGTEVGCSGCNTSATGSVYACWPCNFFLHEYCFNASRSKNHPSHPLHPLTLVPYPTYPSNSFFCNSCNLVGTGLSYSCSNCDFDLHVHCAYMPTTIIQEPHCLELNPSHSLPDPQHTAIMPLIDIRNDPTIVYPQKSEINTSFIAPISYPSMEVSVQADQPEFSSNNGMNQVKTRGVKHFSHSHPLSLSKVEDDDDSIICSGCEEEILGSAYSCSKSKCDFYLHKECFELAREIRHKSHMDHPLSLISTPPNRKAREFTCKACCGVGSAFNYHCSICKFDLHVSCASLPETVKREDHEHVLGLIYSSPITQEMKKEDPGLSFFCDVCITVVPESCWLYFCQECFYGTHLNCVNSEASPKEEPIDESGLDAKLQLQKLQDLQIEMARQNA